MAPVRVIPLLTNSQPAAPSTSSGRCRHFSGEISAGTVDALAKGVAHKADDFYRRSALRLRLLDGLGDALVRLMYECLIKQANLLVEGLEPRFDDLLDDMGRLSLRLGLVGENFSFAAHRVRVEAGGIERLRI